MHLAGVLAPTGRRSDREIVQAARSAGIESFPLSLHAIGDPVLSGLIVGYGGIDAASIPEGLARWRECVR